MDRRSESRQSTSATAGRASRPSSSVGRSASALSFSTTTAAPGRSINTPAKPSAARYGGLAEKEFQKLQSSVRKATKAVAAGGGGAGYRSRGHGAQETLQEQDEYDDEDVRRADPAPEGSFIADEASFSRAPLNPRLPHISPHRVSTAPPRQSRAQHPAHDDDISDSGSLIEEEEEDEQTRLKRERQRRREKGLDKEPLKGLNAELQEALMVEDLLFVLMGIEGRYIEFDPSYSPEDEFERLQGAHFVVDKGLDPWIASVVARFLPLATYYTAITAFTEQYSVLEHGVINHALCAAVREMLRDYLVLLAHLEEQFTSSSSFTLQRFWLLVHPALNTLSLIHALTTDIVALSLPPLSDDTSSEDDSDAASSDDSYGGGGGAMAGILAEMKAASAAARPASSAPQAGWRFGPAKGGEVLHVLFSRLELTSGDPSAKELYSQLLLAASQPYANILVGWISSGRLDDPYDEFIVKETKGINQGSLDLDYTDDYWERRYTLRDRASGASSSSSSSAAGDGAPSSVAGAGKAPHRAGVDDAPRARGLAGGAVVPQFLEPWKDKILLAGKYLNVIRECGIEVEVPVEEVGGGVGRGRRVAMNEESFYKRIDAAYTYANKTLLKLLLEEEHLVSRLESIKQYFFINHGDVFTHFLDMAKLELGKKKKRIMLERLQTQLDLALRNPSSRADDDPYKDDLRIVFEDVTVSEWLLKVVGQTGAVVGPDGIPVEVLEQGKKTAGGAKDAKKSDEQMGWDVFNLDYQVQFPLSLILSRKSITYYQMIFRHLLRLKHLERIFQETWTEHLKTPSWRRRSPYPELQAWKGRVFALRARMYEFVKQMYDFAVSEVLEARWGALRRRMEEVTTVDQLLKDHDNFLNTCTSECLLTNGKLLELFHQKLFNTCYVFANYTSAFTRIVVQAEHEAGGSGAGGQGSWERVQKFDEHWEFLARFEKHFNHHIDASLGFLSLHAARENSGILPLIVRLSSLKAKEGPGAGAGGGH
ncbi:hypothetical protein JCM6882_001641 [Rhodosporidiobolus microsporus]